MHTQQQSDRQADPNAVAIIQGILRGLPDGEREVLRRFYVLKHSPEQICRDLKMESTQLSEIRRNARARYNSARQSA